MFDEDLNVFFNANEFSVEILIQGRCIAGYFSKAYPTLQDHPIPSGHFSFLCAAKDITSISLGESVLIEKNRYQLLGIQFDGTGLATLTLMFIEKLSCR